MIVNIALAILILASQTSCLSLFSSRQPLIPDANPTLFIYDAILNLSGQRSRALRKSLEGKRVWIVGAGGGIGSQLAIALRRSGAKLVLSGRRREELERVALECIEAHENTYENGTDFSDSFVKILPLDITSNDEIMMIAAKKAVSYFEGIDVLILNSGKGQLSPATATLGLHNNDENVDRALMEINYLGPVRLLTKLIYIDEWGKQNVDGNTKKGHVIVTSSVAGKMPLPLGSSYAASKHAIHGYFNSLRTESGNWLRVDLNCPGPIDTQFQERVYSPSKEESEDLDFTHNNISKEKLNGETSGAKMPPKRCAHLMLSAMVGPAQLMKETWISRQPTLFFMYLNQIFPALSMNIFEIIGPLRIKAWQHGLPLYKLSSWIKAVKNEK